ncbi:unnamed protein product [Psylliodes chrysocephalus]|uniref:CCHC-type domain-containing protein n=1 Tax=Psylliodes chrysocephalus TaxID=3402493 RepID=A0A9P0GK60_9CUCU|nr:unnamed protein product [Psylliodes chrysocephala]
MDDTTFSSLAGDPTNKIDSPENPTSNMPYSTALKQNHNQTSNLTTKEQAIVFPSLNNVNLQDADDQVCYECKKPGHKGSDCLNQLNTQSQPQTQPAPTYSNSPPQNNQTLEPNQEINNGDESTIPTTNESMSHCDISPVVETPTTPHTQTNTIELNPKRNSRNHLDQINLHPTPVKTNVMLPKLIVQQ